MTVQALLRTVGTIDHHSFPKEDTR